MGYGPVQTPNLIHNLWQHFSLRQSCNNPTQKVGLAAVHRGVHCPGIQVLASGKMMTEVIRKNVSS